MKENIFLVVVLLAAAIFGYIIMVRLDKFLEKNYKSIENKEDIKKPSCIMLTDDLSDEEIMNEIKSFREKNDNTRVVIYDGKQELEIFDKHNKVEK